jgi:hypothetical protein
MNPYTLTDPDNQFAARTYLAWVREVEAGIRAGRAVQTHWAARTYTTMAAWKADLLRAIHRRINDRAGGLPTGRKWGADYAAAARRDQGRIRDWVLRRVRVYQFETAEARRRYKHLLSDPREG